MIFSTKKPTIGPEQKQKSSSIWQAIVLWLGNPGARPHLSIWGEIASNPEPETLNGEELIAEVISGDYDNRESKNTTCEGSPSSDTVSADSTLNDEVPTVLDLDKDIISTSHGFTGLEKNKLDKLLDKAVELSGSIGTFILMWIILVIWVVIGIVYRATSTWNVVMQDGQSIQSYIWDTTLMRQQLNSAHEQILVAGELRSRIATFKRLIGDQIYLRKNSILKGKNTNLSDADRKLVEGDLPSESTYDLLCTRFGIILGSLPAIIIYWCGIIAWVACGALPISTGNSGPYTGKTSGSNPELSRFNNNWQLYINTAVAVSILISSTFLQNIRARHDKFVARVLQQIFNLDQAIEYRLRKQAGDFNNKNPSIIIRNPHRSVGDKIIDWYADIIGAGIGVFIAIAVFAVWIGIGHLMSYNSNWWLIIGTYTGLVGFLDGFVIRQVYFRVVSHEEDNYVKVAMDDAELFQLIGLDSSDLFSETRPTRKSLQYRISIFINKMCSSQWSVLVSVLIIIGLIACASGLRWSITGQLICNTPTMIIEEFFLLVLIQCHNWADKQRRIEMSKIFVRRKVLFSYVSENLLD